MRQTRARGGDYASVAATRDFGSTLGTAYRTLSLDAWGDYWSDAVFSPFDAGGYFDRSIAGVSSPLLTGRTRQLPGPDATLNPQSFSELTQGLLLDPLALVGPNLRPAFVRAPFAELDLGAGPTVSQGDEGLERLGDLPAPGDRRRPLFAAGVGLLRDPRPLLRRPGRDELFPASSASACSPGPSTGSSASPTPRARRGASPSRGRRSRAATTPRRARRWASSAGATPSAIATS